MIIRDLYHWFMARWARGSGRYARNKTDAAVAAGDNARDLGAWATAAMRYQQALVRDPSLRDIWVQLGHALKEQGQLLASEVAYRRAWALAPDNADTALQLGHVLKLAGQIDEAIKWYKYGVMAGDAVQSAARELIALGVDRHEINALRLLPAISDFTRSERVLWDVTPVWRQVQDGMRPDALTRWYLRIGLAAAVAGMPIEFVVDASNGQTFSILLPDAVQQLSGGIMVARGTACEHVRGASLILAYPRVNNSDIDISSLQTIISDQKLQLFLFDPDITFISRPDWFADDERRGLDHLLKALVPLLAGVIAPGALAARRLSDWAKLVGRDDLPVLTLQLALTRARGMSSVDQGSGLTLAMLPRDPTERGILAAAWRQISSGARLHLVAYLPNDPAGMGAHEFSGDNVTYSDMVGDAYLVALAGAHLLLVPASRTDCDGLIADALCAGVPVMAAPDPAIFERWGPLIQFYTGFGNASALAEQWARAVGKTVPFDHWAASWGLSLSQLNLDDRRYFVTPLPAIVAIGIFYDLALSDLATGLGNGRLLRFGSAWGEISKEGSIHGPAPAILRLRLYDVLTETYVFRLLHRNLGPKDCTLRVVVGSAIGADLNAGGTVVVVPAGKHAWSQVAISAPSGGEPFDTSLTIEILDSAGTDASPGLPLLGGVFVYPLDEDRLWFEFMDDASRCNYPSLMGLHR